MAWDLDLCMDPHDKALIPFHYFVKLQSQPSPVSPRPTFQFLQLPTDIQLIIYECCDASTLFQLMRTSSHTRGQAAKLFWTSPPEDYWYYSESWQFEYRRHHHPILEYCPEFSRRITKVEIDVIRLEMAFREDDKEDRGLFENQRPFTTAAKARVFWSKLLLVFPALKRVVLASMVPRKPLPPLEGEVDVDGDYTLIETVVQCAPPQIVVHIAFYVLKPCKYTLWQVASSPKTLWQILDEDWRPTRLLPPPRKLTIYPLGALFTFTRRDSALQLEHYGLHWLRIESYARYAVDSVIHCPRVDCDATFTERSQWEEHLNKARHRGFDIRYEDSRHSTRELICFEHTPEAEKAAMEAREQRVFAKSRQAREMQRQLGRDWGEAGTERRRLFEEQFFAQLREENLLAPGEVDEKKCSWIELLHMYFDQEPD